MLGLLDWSSVLVSKGYGYKLPQTVQLKTIEIYSLTVLETGSPKSRCQQGPAPSWVSREESFLASSRFWLLPASLTFFGLWQHHSNLFPYSHGLLPCVSFVSSNLSLPTRTPVIGFTAHSNLVWCHLTSITSTKTLFLNKVILTGMRLGLQRIFLGDTIQPPHHPSL